MISVLPIRKPPMWYFFFSLFAIGIGGREAE
jgi:hypothetical protein